MYRGIGLFFAMASTPKVHEKFTRALDDLRRKLPLERRTSKDSVEVCSETCDDVKSMSSDLKQLKNKMMLLLKENQELRTENQTLAGSIEEFKQYQQ